MMTNLTRQMLLAVLIAFCGAIPATAFDQTVYDIQQALTDLGYDPGPVDGAMGAKTRTAITQMQATERLPSTDDLDSVLTQALEVAAAVAAAPKSLPVQVNIQRLGGMVEALTPDFRLYVVADANSALIYDLKSGRMLRGLHGHTEFIEDAAISANGTIVATASDDDTVRLWDTESGRQLRVLRPEKSGSEDGYAASQVKFTPDGQTLLAVSSRGLLTAFDVRTGAEIYQMRSPDGDEVNSAMVISTDGTTVVWTAGGAVAVGDVASGERLRTFSTREAWFNHLSISSDGTRLVALASRERPGTDGWEHDSSIRAFDLHGLEIDSLAVAEDAGWMIVSPDGAEVLLRKEPNRLLRYRFGSGQPEEIETTTDVYPVGYGGNNEVYVDLDGLKAVNISEPFPAQDDRKWSVEIERLEFTDNDILKVLAGEGWTELDIVTGQAKAMELTNTDRNRPTNAYWVDFSAGGLRSLYVEGNKAMVYEGREDGTLLRTVAQPDVDYLSEAALSPNGRYIATIDYDGLLHIWDVESGDLLSRFEAGDSDGLAFSPDSESIAVGTNEYIGIFDWRAERRLHKLSTPSIPTALAFSADGRMVIAGTFEEGVSVWDLRSGRRLWDEKESGSIYEVAFSPDGSRVASSGWGARFAMRDTQTGDLLLAIPALESSDAFAISPNGDRVALATRGGIMIFDVASGEQLAANVFFNGGDWVTITPEGFFAASNNGAQYMTASRGYEAFGIDQLYNALYRPDLVQAKLAGGNAQSIADAAAQLDLTSVVESGGAPDVAVMSPTMGTVLDSDSVEVVVQLIEQGGGIGKIEWRVNGITLGVETRGFDRLAVDTDFAAEPVTVARSLSLDPGENAIEIVAYNAEGIVASEPATVTVNWTGASASAPPKLYVLAAGIDDYHDSRLQLTYAASDARAIAAAFQTAGEGLYESVEVVTVLDAEVTAANLDAVFADLSTKVRPRDVFVLFMAGHGKTQDGRYYFLPQDFLYTDETSVASGGIDQDQFQQWLSLIPARKSLLLYDTCDSGSLTGAVATRGLEEVAALARMTRAMGRTVLSASTDDAPALEGYQGHGVFTYALLQALDEGDTNSDGTIDVTELAGSIDRSVPEISYAAFNLRQIPQMSIVGSDFPVANRVAVLGRPNELITPTVADHVVIDAVSVHLDADAQSTTVGELSPGDTVAVMSVSGDFAMVAYRGQPVGFVLAKALLELR